MLIPLRYSAMTLGESRSGSQVTKIVWSLYGASAFSTISIASEILSSSSGQMSGQWVKPK